MSFKNASKKHDNAKICSLPHVIRACQLRKADQQDRKQESCKSGCEVNGKEVGDDRQGRGCKMLAFCESVCAPFCESFCVHVC